MTVCIISDIKLIQSAVTMAISAC